MFVTLLKYLEIHGTLQMLSFRLALDSACSCFLFSRSAEFLILMIDEHDETCHEFQIKLSKRYCGDVVRLICFWPIPSRVEFLNLRNLRPTFRTDSLTESNSAMVTNISVEI